MTVPSLKVLLIEDNPADALLLRNVLEADRLSTFELTHMERLKDGLQQLEQEKFDIVLTDLGLPDSSGLTAFESLHELAPDLPVVICSGNLDEADAIQAVRNGAQDYLVKSLGGFEMAARTIRYAIERQNLHRSLREGEKRFSVAFHSTPACQIITTFPDGLIIDVNEAFCRLMGYERNKLIGHTTRELQFWANAEERDAAIQAFRTNGRINNREVVLRTRSGDHRTVIASVEAIEIDGLSCVITTSLDITERKQTELALQEKLKLQEQLENTAAVVPGLICAFRQDASGHASMPYASPAIEEIYGLRAEDVAKDFTPIFARIDPQDVPHMQASIAESARTMLPWQDEYRYHHPRKGLRWMAGHSTPVAEPDGSLLWYGIIEDITERKQAEEKLRASEEKWHNLFEILPVGISIVSPGNEVVESNPALAKILDYSTEEISAGEYRARRYLRADHTLMPAEEFPSLRALKEGKIIRDVEIGIEKENGTRIWTSVSAAPFSSRGGTVTVTTDITGRKQVEAELRLRGDVMANMSEGVVLIRAADLSITYTNPKFNAMFGYEAGELIGEKIWVLNDPGQQDPVGRAREIEKTLQETGVWNGEIQNIRKNGEKFWCFANISALDHPQYGMVWVTVQADITARKQAEKELQRSNMLMREMGRIARVGGWELDVATMKQVWTDETYVIHDRQQGEYDPNSTEEISRFEPGSQERIEKAFEEALAQGKPYDLEVEMTTVKGNRKWVRAVCIPVLVDGNVTKLTGTVQDITARKQAEQALTESEERLQLVLEGSQLGYWDWNIETGAVYRNARWAEMLGYTISEITQNVKQWTDLHHPEDRERAWKSLQDHLEGKTDAHRVEYRMRAKDGSYKWILDQARIVARDACGKPLRMSGTHTDITERKKAEAELKESEQRFTNLFRSNPVPVAITRTSDFSIVDVNRAWSDLTGYSREEAIGQTSAGLKLIDPEALGQIRGTLEAQGKVNQVEIPLRTRSGDERKALISSEPIELGGEVYALNNLLDITERKQAEAFLQQSEERHRLISGLISDYAYGGLVYPDGRIQTEWISGAFERITGYALEEINAMPGGFTKMVFPEDLAEIARQTPDFLDMPSATMEYRIHRKDGEIRWLRDYMQRMPGEGPKGAVRRVGAVQDITERKQAEQTNDLLLDVQKKLAVIENVSGVCHLVGEKIHELIGDGFVGISLLDEADQVMRIAGLYGLGNTLEKWIAKAGIDPTRWSYALNKMTAEELRTFRTGNLENFEGGLYRLLLGRVPKPICTAFEKEMNVSGIYTMGFIEHELHLGGVTILARRNIAPFKETIETIVHQAAIVIQQIKAEQALRKSEENFRQIADTINEVFWIFDNQNQKMTYLNPTFEKIWGIPIEDTYRDAQKYIQAIHPDDRPILFASIERQEHGERTEMEYRVVQPNGSIRWIFDRSFPILREDGRVIRTTGVATDITERKLAENSLRESEEKYRTLIESTDDGVFVAKDETFIFANPALSSMLGYDKEEFSNIPFARVLAPDYLEIFSGRFHRRVRGEDVQKNYQTQFITKDGSRRIWIDLRANLITFAGQPAVLGIARDITEQKRNEALIYAQRDLARAVGHFTTTEEGFSVFLRTILELSGLDSGGIYLLDPDYRNLELIQHVGLGDEFVQDILYYPAESPNVKNILLGTPFYYSAADPTIQAPRYEREGIRSLAVIPILYQELVIGCMNLASHTLNDVPDYARHVLETLTPEIGNFAISLRAQEALRERTADLSLMLEAGRSINETLDAKKIYSIIFETVKASLPCDILIVSSFDPQSEQISCVHMQNEEGTHDVANFPPIPLEPPGKGTQSLVIRSGESMLMKDYEAALRTARTNYFFNEEAEIMERKPEPEEDRPRSAIMVPLKMEGKVVGVLQVFSYRLNSYKEDHLRFVETLAFHASASLSNARLFGELEKRVQQRTAEVQDLYDNAPSGYHSLDVNGCFLLINQTELNWLGYARQEVIGHPFSEFVTPDSMETFRANFPVFLKQGWIKDLEFEFVRKDGSTFPILVSATAIRDAEGNYVMSRSTVADITERKKAEQALRESEAQNRLLFEESPVPITLLDGAGCILRANRAYEELTGFPRSEMYGRTSNEIGMVDSHLIAQMTEAMLASMAKQENFAMIEHMLTNANGVQKTVESRIYLLNINNIGHILVTTNDISIHKQVEETLRLANAEMERALRLKDEFLANISHELRTPLNAILGISESLLEQVAGPLNEKQTKYLTTVAESGQHLLELINDVLDLAKVNAGRIELDIDKLDVGMVAQSSLRMIRELAQKKRLDVQFEIDKGVKIIWADERRLKQMLVNLLSNAVKFTPEGGSLGLEIRGDMHEQVIHFTVWDTGIGIAQKDLRLLFQPFVQLDAGLTRGSQGTGLGLVLVSQMARLHGGRVSVQSEPNKGSRFTISIPWTAVGLTSPLVEDPAAQQAQPPSKAGRATILLVEDTEAVSMLIQDYLENHGCQVVTAVNGLEGLDQAKKIHPDLILMDVMMPEMDGLEATRRIRLDPELVNVPIIGLTALAMTGDRERCLEAGMNDYLSKPVQLKSLLQTINDFLSSASGESPKPLSPR